MSKKITQEEFVERAKKCHGDRYDYSLVRLQGLHEKVIVGCPNHGNFAQRANSHIRGTGCPHCAVEVTTSKQTTTKEEFIRKAVGVHGDTYGYSTVEFKSMTDKITILCPQHGEFCQLASNHTAGHGCPSCAYSRISSDKALNTNVFITKATEVHSGKYDYSKTEYIRNQNKVEIVCPVHGSFWQRAGNHLAGIGCRECGIEVKRSGLLKDYEFTKAKSKLTPTGAPSLVGNQREFLCECGRITVTSSYSVSSGKVKSCGNCSNLSVDTWIGKKWGYLQLDKIQEFPKEWSPYSHTKFWFICGYKGCGKRTQVMMSSVTRGHTISCGCVQAGMSEFSPAGQIYTLVSSLSPDAEFSYWFKTDNGDDREYDIFIPSKNLAIEYHGLYYHNEQRKGKRDHEKYVVSSKNSIRLIQIYGDEWETKQEVIKAQLKDLLSPEKKIRIKPVFEVTTGHTPAEVRTFLDAHHYLGAASGCVTIVARHKDQIVGAWVFMKRETGVILWHRACWDRKYKSWNPHEKALKLALPALREMGFKKMITFSDNRFHTGELYEKLGFTFEEALKPDYSYTNSRERKSKFALRVPAGVNEVEEAAKKGWYQIWDSGKRRYSLTI